MSKKFKKGDIVTVLYVPGWPIDVTGPLAEVIYSETKSYTLGIKMLKTFDIYYIRDAYIILANDINKLSDTNKNKVIDIIQV